MAPSAESHECPTKGIGYIPYLGSIDSPFTGSLGSGSRVSPLNYVTVRSASEGAECTVVTPQMFCCCARQ